MAEHGSSHKQNHNKLFHAFIDLIHSRQMYPLFLFANIPDTPDFIYRVFGMGLRKPSLPRQTAPLKLEHGFTGKKADLKI